MSITVIYNLLQPVLTSAKNGDSEKWHSPQERLELGLNMKKP